MSTDVAELVSSIKLADPRPSRCVACAQSAVSLGEEVRFVDFDRIVERGSIVDPGTMAMIDPLVELKVCEQCMRAGLEQLEFKPQLHARQWQRIRQQDVQIDHWRDTAARERAENDRLREYIMRLESEGISVREQPPKRRR